MVLQLILQNNREPKTLPLEEIKSMRKSWKLYINEMLIIISINSKEN